MKKVSDSFGYFDDERREYVITRPDTPRPWINYLGVDSYCGLISHTAGGYSFCRDPRERRILRYRYNSVPEDRPGRYIYLRDDATGTYWSATWQPVMNKKARAGFECRHGMGYTKISAACAGIQTQVTYVVPREETLELWHLRVRNGSGRARKLSLFTYVEFCLWDAMNDMTDFQYNLNIGRTTYSNNTIYHLTNFHAHQPCYAWFWSSAKVKDFDGERGAFLGQSRSEANPVAVERGECSGSLAVGWSPFAGLHVPLSLEPGAEEDVTFVLGYGET